jgi:pseudomonalisin
MENQMRTRRNLIFVLLTLVGPFWTPIHAQVETPRVQFSVVEHVPRWTGVLQDLGPVPDTLSLNHLELVVPRSPQRDKAFQQILKDQYDPKSALYHKWLTPKQLGEEFGADPEILDEVSMWLTSHGLTVNSVSANRVVINFSGTVASVSSAFSVNFHYFDFNGIRLISLTTEPRVSSDIAPKIKFIAGLSSLHLRPAGKAADTKPDLTCATGCVHLVSPADFAIIYGLTSVYQSGTTGSGQTIAAVGFSRVTDSDIESFQQSAGLLTADPVQRVPPTGMDPGPPNPSATDTDFLKEATLDVERAFGVAPSATVILDVTAAPSGTAGDTNPLNIYPHLGRN